jgi:isocitrate dehydrogenase
MMHRLLSVTTNRLLACAAPRTRGIAPTALNARGYAGSSGKISAAPMVYVAGEEMTRYTMELILDRWVRPHVDTSNWEFFDLRAKNRDDTSDQVLRDVIDAGARLKAIFKEPTITPTADQVKRLGLKKAWGSPNGAMRRGWNGITISRDTIHIEGVELGYKKPVFFERHAVGGEYSAGYKIVGKGKLVTTFVPEGETEPVVVDDRQIVDELNAVVTYHNPLDNVTHLARIFFGRCLAAGITPYVVTKKTVFKWQEPFWATMKSVFDAEFKQKFVDARIIAPDAELVHLLSDAATMKLVVWTDGGFGMAAHNYDGDVLTDELAQVHMSPGFITSNLVGVDENGTLIKEFEASHGTVTDMDEARLRGEETSLNPLGMVEGLIGAMNHASDVHGGAESVHPYTAGLRATIHKLFREGRGTRDLCGAGGLTTEQFIDAVAEALPEHINK